MIGVIIPAIDYIFKLSEKAPIIPDWVWWLIGVLGLSIAQFLAFHKMRMKYQYPPALETLTEFLEIGNNLFNVTIHNNADLENLHKQIDSWFDDTKTFIQKSLSITDARLFADITSVKKLSFNPVYNDNHNELLGIHNQYLTNLRSIINRYINKK